jgi:arylsulfatase A-like enzyme
MFIRDPRRKEAVRIDAITRHIDLLPTILDILAIEKKPDVQGVSLVPWMEGRETSQAVGPVYAQVTLRAVKTVKLESFMKDGWKLIINHLPADFVELYHLKDDPHEKQNLAGDEEQKMKRFIQEMLQFQRSLPETKAGKVDLTDEEIKRLRSLGYFQ